MSGSDFNPPEIALGDLVFYHSDPTNPTRPSLAWVARQPGKTTVTCLVYTEHSGFVEKPSCRHIDDPGLRENADWRASGAWELHPTTDAIRKFRTLLPKLLSLVERRDSK